MSWVRIPPEATHFFIFHLPQVSFFLSLISVLSCIIIVRTCTCTVYILYRMFRTCTCIFVLFISQNRFHAKYHPNRVEETRKESLANLKKRAEVFELLFNNGKFDNVPLVMIEGDNIIRMMDTAVILMEGGDENDLKTLDSIPEESNVEKKDNVLEEKDNKKDPDNESSELISCEYRIENLHDYTCTCTFCFVL